MKCGGGRGRTKNKNRGAGALGGGELFAGCCWGNLTTPGERGHRKKFQNAATSAGCLNLLSFKKKNWAGGLVPTTFGTKRLLFTVPVNRCFEGEGPPHMRRPQLRFFRFFGPGWRQGEWGAGKMVGQIIFFRDANEHIHGWANCRHRPTHTKLLIQDNVLCIWFLGRCFRTQGGGARWLGCAIPVDRHTKKR